MSTLGGSSDAEETGFLPHTRDIWTEGLATGFSLTSACFCEHLGSESADRNFLFLFASQITLFKKCLERDFVAKMFHNLSQNQAKYVNKMFLGLLRQRERFSKGRVISFLRA